MQLLDDKLKITPLFEEEIELLSPRLKPKLIDWLESKFYLSGGTAALEGFWSREYGPYFVPIAEWFDDPMIREIWVFGPTQFGKSTFLTGCSGYIVDCSPGPTMLIMPTKDDVRNRIESRIRPMFAANEDLLSHVRGKRVTNIFIGKQTVMDHMNLYIGWPTTPQALADKPCCYLFPDETGKYPAVVGEEASPIDLMRKRQLWFKTRSKLVAMTTPVTAGDLSDMEWSRGDRCEWWVPCMKCGRWHQIDRHNVDIDKKKDGGYHEENYYKTGNHYRYICPKCKNAWTEDDRWRSVCAGIFVPGYTRLNEDGKPLDEIRFTNYKSCRIHLLMLHKRLDPMRILVTEYVHAMKQLDGGNIQPYKDFRNSREALPWKEKQMQTDIERLKSHIGSYEKGIVPVGVEMLVAGLDVQLDHVWFMVFGFGYLGEWWTIFEQRIETGPTDRVENLEKLLPYLMMGFPLEENRTIEMHIALSAIDTKYHSDSVKAFCVRCIGAAPIIPVAGDDSLKKQMTRVSKESGGIVNVYHLNTCVYKDRVFRSYFESTESGPGYGHFHKDTEYIVLQHFCAEEKVIERKGERISWIGWKPKKGGLPNHYWDDAYYALSAADIAGLWTIPNPETVKQAPQKVTDKTKPTKYDSRARL